MTRNSYISYNVTFKVTVFAAMFRLVLQGVFVFSGVCTRLCDGAPALYAGPLGKATLTGHLTLQAWVDLLCIT